MNWHDLWAALALLLVFEGLLPFVSPQGFRRSLSQIGALPDRTLRTIGLGSMVAGVVLLYWVRG